MLLLVTYFAEPFVVYAVMVLHRKQQQQKQTINAQFSQYNSEILGNTGRHPVLREEAPRMASAGNSFMSKF